MLLQCLLLGLLLRLHQLNVQWKFSSSQTDIDGYLFFIKHLLIVREQIAAFDVDFVITDVSLDFTKTKGTFFNNSVNETTGRGMSIYDRKLYFANVKIIKCTNVNNCFTLPFHFLMTQVVQ